MKLVDKLWNWGHLEGSHNEITGHNCKMTPEQFAEEYGIRNAFIVSYGGNIQVPFDSFAERFSGLREIVWSVLGDGSTPLPEAELGNTEDILAVLHENSNITGGVVDDFFYPTRMERFTPEVLKKIKKTLNDRGLKFWCVLYSSQFNYDLEKYLDCFDGFTYWIWFCRDIADLDTHLGNFFKLVGDREKMLGIYLWDYGDEKPMKLDLFEKQLSTYFNLLAEKTIDGVIFCSSTVGDANLLTCELLKKYIKEMGNIEIE